MIRFITVAIMELVLEAQTGRFSEFEDFFLPNFLTTIMRQSGIF